MIIDFKEIPPANKGGGEQDRFEQFACDFLETIGFTIIRRPDRGPDGKKDLIVREIRSGIAGATTINWLVSCKHNAHSSIAVKDVDEPDIPDRLTKHNCQAFLGIYSTLQASTLSDKLYALRDKFESTTYDSTRIEKELLRCNQRERLLKSYFPLSHDKYQEQKLQDNAVETVNPQNCASALSEADVLRIAKTAIILLEIEKIKEEYESNKFKNAENPLYQLYRFTDHSNEKVASAIFQFLNSIADETRITKSSSIAASLHSLVLTFFPSSYDTEREARIENGRQCIYIGFGLVYDAFIHLNKFKIAEYGLSIWKFIYREGKRRDMPELSEAVLLQYKELEGTLDRPEPNGLGNAKKLIAIFKNDLETGDLSFPVLPEDLYKLSEQGDQIS